MSLHDFEDIARNQVVSELFIKNYINKIHLIAVVDYTTSFVTYDYTDTKRTKSSVKSLILDRDTTYIFYFNT